MTDEEFIAIMRSNGYVCVQKLPNGMWVGMQRMLYTTGLFIGLTVEGYSGRYCYERFADVKDALQTWDGTGDPPGPWIKYKGVNLEGMHEAESRYEERLNPRMKHESDPNPTTV